MLIINLIMPKLLEITELGSPVLRRKAVQIEHIPSKKLIELVEDMIYTVSRVNGVGLAAPQVSESIRLFIMASEPNPRYPDAPDMEPVALINPEIISGSEEVIKGWEGCLSIPGLRGLVPRHRSVKISFQNIDGNEVINEFSDFTARIFQHEFDHINGIVFLDRLESTRDIITDKEYEKLLKKNES